MFFQGSFSNEIKRWQSCDASVRGHSWRRAPLGLWFSTRPRISTTVTARRAQGGREQSFNAAFQVSLQLRSQLGSTWRCHGYILAVSYRGCTKPITHNMQIVTRPNTRMHTQTLSKKRTQESPSCFHTHTDTHAHTQIMNGRLPPHKRDLTQDLKWQRESQGDKIKISQGRAGTLRGRYYFCRARGSIDSSAFTFLAYRGIQRIRPGRTGETKST